MILVTGASGNIGSELVKRLSASKAKFRAGYRNPSKSRPGVDSVALDYRRPESLRAAFRDVKSLFLASGNDPEQQQLELSAVREAKEAGIERIVKLSVWGANTESFSYAKIHRPVERAIEGSGMRWTLLRPNGFMQNLGNFYAGSIKGHNSFALPAGDAKVSHVDARDVASVAAALLTSTSHDHDAEAYELSGPEALTFEQVAEELTRQLGRTIRYHDLNDEDFVDGAVAAGVEEPQARNLVELMQYYKTGDASRLSPLVEKLAGKRPFSLRQYVTDYLTLFR